VPLDLTDDEWFARLNTRRLRAQHDTDRYWQYYDNEQPLAYVAKILQEQGDRFPPLRINWSALVVDALEERLDIEGFRIGAGDIDDDLTEVWQANDLDEGSGEGHIAALVARQAYIMVGPGVDTDIPLVTVEYPDQVAVEVDPATRRVVAALKVWSPDTENGSETMATLHVPGRIITFESGEKVDQQRLGWAKKLEQHQTSPLVGVVPMLNRPRRWVGRSELDQIIPLVDGVNQTATNMLAAIEHHALPRRWAVNVAESDFTDADGKPVPAWKIATGAIWAIPRADDDTGILGEQAQPKVGQFTAAALDNFHNSIKQLAVLASSLYGLPPHYMGYSSENPASADAIRSSEARLVKRAERRQRTFGGAWERAMRIALAVMDRDPSEANGLETVWRDAATPTKAAAADAAVKMVQAGVIDQEQAQEDSGYTPAQREAMRRRRDTQLDRTGSIVAGIRGIDLTAQTGQTTPPEDAEAAPARPAQQVTGAPAVRPR
jgi:hypothetical protein